MKFTFPCFHQTILTIATVLIGLSGIAPAQQPPYDVYPDAEPPYYRIRYEASTQASELVYPVNYTIWIPPHVEDLRGVVVHQHGCGEGSCKSGLTGAFDLHWQALAKKHDCALMAPSYEQSQEKPCDLWCDPRNGSDAAFHNALVDLGKASGHPELAIVPWALWGHSGGGTWAGTMTLLHPERVAAAWLRSGVPATRPRPDRPSANLIEIPDEALGVPIMLNPGTKEGVSVKDGRFSSVWPRMKQLLLDMRSEGALIGAAIDPLTSHECGNQRYLAVPWLDACLRARLPDTKGEPLKPMPTSDSWLAPLLATEAVPEPEFIGDQQKAVWLPNRSIAKAWMQYVKDTQVADSTPPPAPSDVKLVDGQLTWNADADLDSGLAHFIIRRDGKEIGRVPAKSKNPYGRPIFQGLQYSDTPIQPLVQMRFSESSARPGRIDDYQVIAVNTVGLESQ